MKQFAPNDRVCKFCLQEKLSILRSALSLNERSEIFGHCIHRKKFSCLAILPIHCQPMRSPCRPKFTVLPKNYRLSILTIYINNIHTHTHTYNFTDKTNICLNNVKKNNYSNNLRKQYVQKQHSNII